MREHAEEVRRLIANIDGVTEVTTDADSGDDEIQLLIEQTQVAMAGTSPYVVARTVDFALRGVRLPDMKREGREIPLWARFRGDDRKSITDLDNVAVLTSSGSLVTLENLVRKQRAGTPTSITRVDGKNVVNITAKTYGRIFSKVTDDIAALTGLINLPPGYTLDIGDEAEELDTSFRNFRIALVFAIILIYIVMGAVRIVRPAASILSSVPLALSGCTGACTKGGAARFRVAHRRDPDVRGDRQRHRHRRPHQPVAPARPGPGIRHSRHRANGSGPC